MRVSPVRALSVLVGVLLVGYIALLATVMTYGAIQVQAAEAVRDTSSDVAALETRYLAAVSALNHADPTALGYMKPAAVAYITGTQTAVSMRTR